MGSLKTPTRGDRIFFKRPNLSPLDQDKALECLQDGLNFVADKLPLFWVTSGTLLGIHRDNQFIPHDTDIDICAAIDINNDNHAQITAKLEDPKFELIAYAHSQDFPMQLAFEHENGTVFDIYFYYDGVFDDVLVNYGPEGQIRKPKHFVDALGFIPFRGIDIPHPTPLDEFLVWRFGEDWQTPKKSKKPWQEEANHLEVWK